MSPKYRADPKEEKEERKRAGRRDRSKFKKTDQRQRARLKKTETIERLAKKEGLKRGRVLSITPGEVSVDFESRIYLCVLRGILKKETSSAKNLLAIGDFVLFDPITCAIDHVEPRISVLSRQDHLRRRKMQLIAANIDQVLITVSVTSPPLKPHLIDRYIIATYKGGMEPVIVVNKIDLLEDKKGFKALVAIYEELGIPVISVSAKKGRNMAALKKQMKGKASVFSGQSGVGKSSLINAVTGLELPVGEVVQKTRKGAHTTSRAHLIPLSFGGWCIDTPGIRSFGIWNLTLEDLCSYFPEIESLGKQCRYPNCTHTHEPGCRVEEGGVSPLRLNSYRKLLSELKDENKS